MKATQIEIELFEKEKQLFIENGKKNEIKEIDDPFSYSLFIKVKEFEKANDKLVNEKIKMELKSLKIDRAFFISLSCISTLAFIILLLIR